MRRLTRIAASVAAAVVVLLLAAIAYVWVGSDRALAAPASTGVAFSAAGGDADHGGHLATILGCTNCHGADLAGASMNLEASVGTLWAPNLTRGAGGVGGVYTGGDFEGALRHGVRRGGGAFLVMPSSSYAALSDEDTRDLIAYLHTLPPVDRTTPARSLAPLARLALVTGKLQPQTQAIASGLSPLVSRPSDDVAFGHYLAAVAGCMACHGVTLGGGRSSDPKAPPAPDLTTSAAAANWTLAEFTSTLREGQAPDGHVLDASMPWKSIGQMTDAELSALDQYLKSLPAAHP